jgi:CheY-like chemotaxis protein
MARTLLLADGNTAIQRIVALTFAGEDVDVVSVSDGASAMARIAAEHPDIVLADVSMPKRSGYEIAAFVKGQPELAHIPVLLMAGALEPVDEARAAEVHCNGVLIKPFEPQQVIARVRELIGGAKGHPTQGTAGVPRPIERLMESKVAATALPERREEAPLKLVKPAAEPPVSAVRPAAKPAAVPSPARVAPPPSVAAELDDDPLADYFDQLDAAFDSMDGGTQGRSDAFRPKAVTSEEETTKLEVPTLESVLGDMSPSPSPAKEQILFAAPPVERPDIRPVPPVEPRREISGFRAVAPVKSPAAEAQASPIDMPVPPPAPTPASAPAPAAAAAAAAAVPAATPAPTAPGAPGQADDRQPVADTRRSATAEAFEALLATIEKQRLAIAEPPLSPVISDELVEAVASRVIQRLAPDGVTDLVVRIVSEVAERLVREEIDGIRGRK